MSDLEGLATLFELHQGLLSPVDHHVNALVVQHGAVFLELAHDALQQKHSVA